MGADSGKIEQASSRWRRPSRKLLLVVFIVVPLVAIWTANPVLFHVFGNGHNIAPGSPGTAIVRWWEHAGREIFVGAVALLILLARRVFPPVALGLATGAGVTTVGWWVLSLLLTLAIHPGALD